MTASRAVALNWPLAVVCFALGAMLFGFDAAEPVTCTCTIQPAGISSAPGIGTPASQAPLGRARSD